MFDGTTESSDFLDGVDTFTFVVLNDSTGGRPTGFDFSATATPPAVSAVTPEPSSILLLCTGLLEVAGVMKRPFLNLLAMKNPCLRSEV